MRGGRVTWSDLYEGRRRRPVALSTTAFRRKRYWVGYTGRPKPSQTQATPDTSRPGVPRRRPGPRPEAEPGAGTVSRPGATASPASASAAASTGRAQDPGGPGPARNPGEDIGRYLADYFTEALGLDAGELPMDKDLHGVGVDSILWARLQRAVRADLGLTLTTREIVELATLERITAVLTAKRAPEAVAPPTPETTDDVREARAKALEAFRQGDVGLEDLKALMKEAPGA